MGDRELRRLARRIEYEKEAFATDLYSSAIRPLWSRSPRSRMATPQRRLRRRNVRHEAEYFIPTEHHNPMELFRLHRDVGRRRQAHGL